MRMGAMTIHTERKGGEDVLLNVLSYTWQLNLDGNSNLCEHITTANPRNFKNMRRGQSSTKRNPSQYLILACNSVYV